MRCINVLPPRAGLFVAVVGIAILCARTAAQDETTGGSTSEANASGEAQEPKGWLILEGKLIPGPYDVRTLKSEIQINGKNIRKPRKPAVSIAVNPSAAAVHQVVQTLRAALRTWVLEDGAVVARERALEFMESQPLVDDVRFHSDTHLRVIFRGEEVPEYINLHVRSQPGLSKEQVRAQYLESQVKALKYWLTHGALVILNEGVLMATPPGEGEATVQQLQEMAASETDLDRRAAAIGELIPDREMAKAIAERLLDD